MFDIFVQNQDFLGYLWLIATLFLLLSEVGTPGLFVFISLATGTFSAALIAFLGFSWFIQCWAVVLATLVSFTCFNYLLSKKKKPLTKTNVDALIHQEAVVIEPIEPRKTGRVKIRGQEWPAIADYHVVFQKGSIVTVIRVEGNKLVVK